MGAHIYLVADLIGAQILIVQHQVHELIGRTEIQSRKVAHGRRHCIANHRLVASIGQQRPLLCLGIPLTQELLLLIELDLIRLLAQIPSRIATSANLRRVVDRDHVVLVDIAQRGVDVNILACDGGIVEGVDIDGGQVGASRPLSSNRKAKQEKQGQRKASSKVYLHIGLIVSLVRSVFGCKITHKRWKRSTSWKNLSLNATNLSLNSSKNS